MGYIGSDPKTKESVSTSQLINDSVTNEKIVDDIQFNSVTSSIVSASADIIADTFSGTFSGALSSSAQIADNISGSFTPISSSVSSRLTLVEDGTTSKALVSASAISSAAQGQVTLTTNGVAATAVDLGLQSSDSPTFADVTVTGTLTAQEIHTEFESASILFTSGSTKIGNSGDDIHQMTGSVKISGSFRAETSQIQFFDDNTEIGVLENSSENLKIESKVQDKDIIFSGNDGGAGIEAMRIDMSAGGFVGIGTDDPGSYYSDFNNLVVRENGNAGIAIIGSTSGESSLGFGDGTGAATYRGAVAYVHTSGDHQDKMFFKTSATNRVVIDSSGYVGINNLTPSAHLDVAGGAIIGGDTIVGRTGNQKGKLTIQSRTGTASRKTNAIVAVPYNDTSESICMIGMDGQSSNNEMHIGSNTGDFMSPTYIDFFTAADVNSQTNSRVMRMTSEQKVSIGTDTPLATLHVEHTTDDTDENGNIALTVGGGANGNVRHYWGINNSGNYAYYGAVEHATQYVPLVLQPNGSNVGIGTTNPTGKLQIRDTTTGTVGETLTLDTDQTLGGRGTMIRFTGNNRGFVGAEIQGRIDQDSTEKMSLLFKTNNGSATNEIMRITADSKVGIGTIAPAYKLHVESSSGDEAFMIKNKDSSGPQGMLIHFSAAAPDNSTSKKFMQLYDNVADRVAIWSDGDIQNHDNSYGQISDERIKTSITDANSQWDDIKALKVKNFKRKDDVSQYGDDAWTQIGVIAQDLESAGMGKLIKKTKPSEFEINNCGISADDYTKGVKYSVLYMKAVKALQEAMTRIETLETQMSQVSGSS